VNTTLVAIAETAIPAGRYIPAAGEATVAKVERFLETLPQAVRRGIKALITAIDATSYLKHRAPFAKLSFERRLALLESFRTGDAVRRLMLRALVSPIKIAHFDDPALYKQLGCVYDHERARAEVKPARSRARRARR